VPEAHVYKGDRALAVARELGRDVRVRDTAAESGWREVTPDAYAYLAGPDDTARQSVSRAIEPGLEVPFDVFVGWEMAHQIREAAADPETAIIQGRSFGPGWLGEVELDQYKYMFKAECVVLESPAHAADPIADATYAIRASFWAGTEGAFDSDWRVACNLVEAIAIVVEEAAKEFDRQEDCDDFLEGEIPEDDDPAGPWGEERP